MYIYEPQAKIAKVKRWIFVKAAEEKLPKTETFPGSKWSRFNTDYLLTCKCIIHGLQQFSNEIQSVLAWSWSHMVLSCWTHILLDVSYSCGRCSHWLFSVLESQWSWTPFCYHLLSISNISYRPLILSVWRSTWIIQFLKRGWFGHYRLRNIKGRANTGSHFGPMEVNPALFLVVLQLMITLKCWLMQLLCILQYENLKTHL